MRNPFGLRWPIFVKPKDTTTIDIVEDDEFDGDNEAWGDGIESTPIAEIVAMRKPIDYKLAEMSYPECCTRT